jgi:hypothetical protein
MKMRIEAMARKFVECERRLLFELATLLGESMVSFGAKALFTCGFVKTSWTEKRSAGAEA